jgi:LL-diaminopimelate aminotransferase
MIRINENYTKLKASYLFSDIAKRVSAYVAANPGKPVIRLGIGDVTEPLPAVCLEALHKATDEMGQRATFRGYGPEQGYDFLLDAIREHDFAARGVEIGRDEIFVSDGSKCDSGNVQELFHAAARIAISDPVYPVYVDSNVMAGRTGPLGADGRFGGLVYMPGNEANGFQPAPPAEPVDFVYLCSPNNPTGTVASRAQLEAWVAWARQHRAIILFDAAYEAYIADPAVPHSIFEIEGARECAIELRSFSKRAGFTGVRCGFMVIPKQLSGEGEHGEPRSLNAMWSRRHSTKFNGTSYVVQCGAAAAYSPEGRAETMAQVAFYMDNARRMREGLGKAGFTIFGGVHAPYLWIRTPDRMPSWDFFDLLLERAHVVGTPGAGFGPGGEGYFRLSAFNSQANVDEAIGRVIKAFA